MTLYFGLFLYFHILCFMLSSAINSFNLVLWLISSPLIPLWFRLVLLVWWVYYLYILYLFFIYFSTRKSWSLTYILLALYYFYFLPPLFPLLFFILTDGLLFFLAFISFYLPLF